ncbi:MAG TPA: hypothetical protein PLX89_08735 [Verrucomicrobiota bacterium]|nr:hypothetical protein [Verrucomicrobiales bacterium]HRI13078.1 hypothetical protein [Verrucomicrobiota bacterium]
MPKGRFILRFTGEGEPSADEYQRIRALPELRVVDSSARMLLVESPEATLKRFVNEMPSWSLTPERTIPLPDPRPKLKGR